MRLPLLLHVVAYLLLMLLSAAICQHLLYQQLRSEAALQSNNLAAFLRYSIGRYQTLPARLAESPLLQQQLDSNPSQLNAYLAELQQSAAVADLYLLDTQGKVLAASNYRSAYSYVGRDFAFRPYVRVALAGQPGFYYALGHTSGMRGVYYSAPVFDSQQRVRGALALKVDLEPLELQQQQIAGLSGSHFLVSGHSNEIFLSDVADWRLHKLDAQPLSASERQRYLTRTLAPLSYQQSRALLTPWQQIWQLPLAGRLQPFLSVSQPLDEFGWQLRVLIPARDINHQLLAALTLMSLLYLSALLGWRLQRERRKRQLLLVNQKQQLEQRVLSRTAELADSNARLLQQIAQREQTETALARTEQELVQAARLATIGNLSASLNHELNQPLTALSSYCQTTRKLLDKQLFSEADKNLQTMQQLISRLGNIVAQFKDFSRKSAGRSQPVALGELVQAALVLVQHQLERQQVQLDWQPPAEEVVVSGDPIQLEQVLVNLLTNALQAMQQQSAPRLQLQLSGEQQQAVLLLRDSGPGIEPHHLGKIFEAFFTTKQRDGLGLGLSISQRIVQSFGGSLTVRNHPQGGAEFTLRLPLLPAALQAGPVLPSRETAQPGIFE